MLYLASTSYSFQALGMLLLLQQYELHNADFKSV